MDRYLRTLITLLLHAYHCAVGLAFAVYYRLFVGPPRPIAFPSKSCEEDAIYFLSATQAAREIREGRLSSRELVEAYVKRIQRVEPLVHALVYECFDSALEHADAVHAYLRGIDRHSEEFHSLATTQPLLGVPFSVKNNIDLAGYVTCAGNPAFKSNLPAQVDADVVRNLKTAGAIPIAVTTLPYLAANWQTYDPISRRYTRNPYDLRKNPGGSSGGEGALVGGGASIFGLGNDSGGSVRIPASMCGCFGLKLTAGLVPLNGMVPPVIEATRKEVWSIGPLCRFAEDLPVILRSMLPADSSAKLHLDQPVDFARLRLFYADHLDIAISRPVQPIMKDAVAKVASYFRSEHGVHPHKVELPLARHAPEMWQAWYDRDEPEGSESVAKIAQYAWDIITGKSDDAPQHIMERLYKLHMIPTKEAKQSLLEKREQLRAEVLDLLTGREGEPSLLLLPAYPHQATYLGESAWVPYGWIYTGLFNTVGLPAIVVPMGLAANAAPVSVQLVGAPHTEALLIETAKRLEKAFGGWAHATVEA